MKVIQIIDSLEAGGAERMAVNIANALSKHGIESHLCVTRKEGVLKNDLTQSVHYKFLKREGKLGIIGIYELFKYCKNNQITHIHAHSTSFSTGAIVKFLLKQIKLTWHDHYGQRVNQTIKENRILLLCSKRFDSVITVNQDMKDWVLTNLKILNTVYLNNFATRNELPLMSPLKGSLGKRIVCIANLRADKDHLNLIHAFNLTSKLHMDWTLHICGKDFNDTYSFKLKKLIEDNRLKNKVFILGSRPDVGAVLEQCDIAVLSSKSEGLPVALLEYGLHQLPVITTDVGACAEVVQNYGIVVPFKNAELLATAIKKMIASKELRENYATQFHNHIVENYGSDRYVEKLLEIYN